jgi:lipoprotein-anchoring transpeptidase ErfK/SrfK
MISGNGYLQFLQKAFAQFKTRAVIVSWILVISRMVMVPVLFVFVSPSLIASQPAPLFMAQGMPPQEEKREKANPVPTTHIRETVPDEAKSSFVHPRSPSSPKPPHHVFDHPREEIHLLLDTSRHRLFVKHGDRILHTATASTGKGTLLVDPQNPERVWIFDTPKGRFRIQSKLENPVWIRPDWDFIERGDAVPEKFGDRLMPGVLGSYALGFGDGYFIHGALYLNLLGQDVTHGCIQLHPEDLQFVFDTVPLGALFIIT